jgi:hypothetical protein
VRITTDLDIKGRAAAMGQGVIVDVSRRLVSQAATCIEARLAAPADVAMSGLPTAGPVGGISLMASVVGSRVRGLAASLGGRGGDADDPEPEPPEGVDDGPR